MNSDHAPTAEQQLPPPIVTDRDIDDAMEMIQDDFRASELAIYLAAKRERDAALRENREKDARIAELEYRIGELEGRYQASVKDRRDFRSAMKLARKHQEAAEAKLRAVSDAIEGKLEGPLGARIRAIVEGK